MMLLFIVKGNTNGIERLKGHFWEALYHFRTIHGPRVSKAVCAFWCYCLTMGHFSTLRNLTSLLTMDGISCQVFFKVNVPKHNRSFFRPYPAWSLVIICFFLKVLTMDYYDTTFFYLSSSFLAALSKKVQINSNFSVVIYKVLQV